MTWLADADIDALAAHRFLVKDGFVGDAVALAAQAEALALSLRPGGMSRATSYHHDELLRGDDIAWVTPEMTQDGSMPALALVHERFEELRVQLNRTAYLGLERFDVQVARYHSGGPGYVRHRDAFPGGPQPNRRLTAILYLNPGWTPPLGGRLRLHPPDRPHEDVDPLLDRLVVFPSEEIEHEVLPTHAPRIAVTAWYYGRGV